MDTLIYQFDQEMAQCNKALQSLGNINEVLTVIGKYGLQESIKDLFGNELKMIVPSYESTDPEFNINKFDVAQKGLGTYLMDIVKTIWKKIVEFVDSAFEFFKNKVGILVNRIKKLLGIGIDEAKYRELCKTTECNVSKAEIDGYIQVAKTSTFKDVIDDLISMPLDAASTKHTNHLRVIGLTYDKNANELIHSAISYAGRDTLVAQGFGKDSKQDITWLNIHATWLTDHRNLGLSNKAEIKAASERVTASMPDLSKMTDFARAVEEAKYNKKTASVVMFIKSYYVNKNRIVDTLTVVTDTIAVAALP